MSKDKPYKEPPEFYWFRSTLLGSYPIRREGWLTLLIGFGGFGLCVLLMIGSMKIGLTVAIVPLMIIAAVLLFGMIVVSAVRTDRRW